MKKIMFNNRYGLTAAVLQGRKTMTRRICKEYATHQPILTRDVESFCFYPDENIVEFLMKDGTIKVSVPPYKDNEIVAVAQSYETLANSGHLDQMTVPANNPVQLEFKKEYTGKGWSNKMFVRADLMPHFIQITNINIERLQDITDEDCLKEGIRLYTTGIPQCKTQVVGSLEFIPPYGFDDYHHKHFCNFDTPREAFAALINRPGVGRKGLWEENPFVFAYSFKLIK